MVILTIREAPGTCPVCGHKLEIKRLHCRHCDTALEGSFLTCRFCQLNKEQREFVEIFIKSRGNIKEVEREMGISYPTVRNRLDGVITALGYKIEPQPEEEKVNTKRKEILDAVSRGEMSAQEALKLLKK